MLEGIGIFSEDKLLKYIAHVIEQANRSKVVEVSFRLIWICYLDDY